MPLRLLLMILIGHGAEAQLYTFYERPHRWSATVEAGGISPVLAVNAEYSLFQTGRTFTVIHLGIGHTFTNYSLHSLPHALTLNYLLNRRKPRCPPPIGEPKQWFLEVGAGGLVFNSPKDKEYYRFTPIIGVRRYQTARYTRTRYFYKAQFTPLILGKLLPWGGIGLGMIL
ncbi:hypothetical protein [Telluribacter sp.]|jgi:hypothetical protein|uniref:hypothetical protein n=1 Tax=Telluribacter sp. TaxID=1978767 RepID=UPI002E10BA5B|nr:hypothetical protein [Telluribacter sp.]